MERLAGKAWALGYQGDRVAANFMCEQFARKARAAIERVEDAGRRLSEARTRVSARRRAAEAAPHDTRRARELEQAWSSNVVAGTELAKALRDSDMAWHQFRLVLKEWGPSAGPIRQVAEARAERTEFERACESEVRESEARFRSELAAWEASYTPRFHEPPKPEKHGAYRVMRRTDGCWLVIDERRPMGDRTVAEVGFQLVDANEHARRLFDRENAAAPQAVGT